MTITHRTLRPDERDRIKEAGGPLAQVDLSRMTNALIAVVEVDGAVVAYWPVWTAVHAEPAWIDEPYRKHAGINRALWTELQTVLEQVGEPVVFAIIGQDGVEEGAKYVERLHLQPVPGTLHYLILQPATQPVAG